LPKGQKAKTQSGLVLGVLAFWRHIVKLTSSNTAKKVTTANGAQIANYQSTIGTSDGPLDSDLGTFSIACILLFYD